MNIRLIFCILMGVFTTYMGIAMLFSHFHAVPPSAPVFKPNFTTRSQAVADPVTGETVIHREITVTTKLADPGPLAFRLSPARPPALPPPR